MKSTRKLALPLLATIGLIVILFRGRPNWVMLPQRTTPTGASGKLQVPKDKFVIGSIDSHDEKWQMHGQSGSLLEASGWIASTRMDDPISKIDVLINDQPAASVHISFARPDVSAAFDRPDFKMSGWRVLVPLDGIKAGEYELGVKGTTVRGKEGGLPPLKLFVTE